ncbi:Maintenance of telomere capping protein, partial [Lachnellula suecica]
SQRDLGLTVPINFVTSPGVSLQAACFAHFNYEDGNSEECLSNLLAVGFRRFELDLYWDQGRNVWSFCPVSIPTSIPASATPTSTSSFSSSTLAALTSGTVAMIPSQALEARQNTASLSETLSSSSLFVGSSSAVDSMASIVSNMTGTSLGNNVSSIALLPGSSNDPLVSIPPYVCTATINLSTFTSQIQSYILQTQNTLDARFLHVTLNIHAAASYDSPLSSAPEPTLFPGPTNSLSSLFAGNPDLYLYTPSELASDRANLNASWYTVASIYRPAEDYYEVSTSEYKIASTEDGWPSESYVEFQKSKRVLLGWGTVDPQMAGYNFSGDIGTIFPSGYTQTFPPDLTADSTGDLTSGCFMRNSSDDLSNVNSSWAADSNFPGFDYPTTATANITPFLNLTSNSANCGISPILNVTLLNATANTNYQPYENFTAATIWSWAPGEPRNYTSSDADSDSLFRCATANPDLAGRWAVSDCSQKYYAACRANGQPYNWTITAYPVSYSYAKQTCPKNYQFAAPRTALENSYLAQALRQNHRDYDGHGAWVDFNDLDYKTCWVTGGPNATCPYKAILVQDSDAKRTTLIPAIGGVIVGVIFLLTLFIACYNRRSTKKRTRRRADNGFVYEGVPS